jgi:hypothetical protein
MATDLINARALTKWEEASYAFLAEKERRSGSTRTVQSYARMLKHFFSEGKTPDQVTSQEVVGGAHGLGRSGKTPSSVTGGRIGCRSSFYRFLIRMGLLQAHSCDALQRPGVKTSGPGRQTHRSGFQPPTPRVRPEAPARLLKAQHELDDASGQKRATEACGHGAAMLGL